MSQKHYIWAADYVVSQQLSKQSQGYKTSREYQAFLRFFTVFGEKFDPIKFNNYIEKKLETE